MLPISICIATIAMTFGIGGAAFFSPVFIVLFPLIKVPTLAASDAFGAALLTELAGFTSGLIGYGYKGLIDYRTAFILSIMSVPMAIMGTMMKSMIAKKFGSQYLILTFAVVLLILVIYIIFNPVDHKPETDIEQLKESQNEKV